MDREKKTIIIISIAILIIAVILFIVGGLFSGWNIVGFLKSKTAILIYVLLAVFVLLCSLLFLE